SRFQDALRLAFSVAKDNPNALVTFGIVPTFGHTGLGYIHRGDSLYSAKEGGYKVLAFKEKPDKATADRYYWNSGMFVWRADTVLRELSMHLPDAHRGLMQIADAWNTPQQQPVL